MATLGLMDTVVWKYYHSTGKWPVRVRRGENFPIPDLGPPVLACLSFLSLLGVLIHRLGGRKADGENSCSLRRCWLSVRAAHGSVGVDVECWESGQWLKPDPGPANLTQLNRLAVKTRLPTEAQSWFLISCVKTGHRQKPQWNHMLPQSIWDEFLWTKIGTVRLYWTQVERLLGPEQIESCDRPERLTFFQGDNILECCSHTDSLLYTFHQITALPPTKFNHIWPWTYIPYIRWPTDCPCSVNMTQCRE